MKSSQTPLVTGNATTILAFAAVALALVPVSAVAATVPTGSSPYSVAVNSVTNRVYVANQSSNNVTVIDGATNATTTVSAGSLPTSGPTGFMVLPEIVN